MGAVRLEYSSPNTNSLKPSVLVVKMHRAPNALIRFRLWDEFSFWRGRGGKVGLIELAKVSCFLNCQLGDMTGHLRAELDYHHDQAFV